MNKSLFPSHYERRRDSLYIASLILVIIASAPAPFSVDIFTAIINMTNQSTNKSSSIQEEWTKMAIFTLAVWGKPRTNIPEKKTTIHIPLLICILCKITHNHRTIDNINRTIHSWANTNFSTHIHRFERIYIISPIQFSRLVPTSPYSTMVK